MKKSILNLDKLVLNKEVMFDLTSGQMNGLKGGVTQVTENSCVSNTTMCGSEHSRCISICEENCTGTDTFICTIDQIVQVIFHALAKLVLQHQPAKFSFCKTITTNLSGYCILLFCIFTYKNISKSTCGI